MGASWISNAMLFGLVSITGTFLRAFSVVKGRVYNAMIWIGFALSMAMMVVRTGDTVTLGVASCSSHNVWCVDVNESTI